MITEVAPAGQIIEVSEFAESVAAPAPPAAPAVRRPAYTAEAGSYDRRTRQYQHYRRRLVDMLPLSRGDVVLDVGCGTGLCLAHLVERVGPSGAVVGIDQSPEMLALADQRVAEHGWRNVTLIESAVEDVDIPVTADAALFSAVHDILRSWRALDNVLGHVKPGGWVAAAGGKWAPSWMVALNVLVRATHQPFVNDFESFDEPLRLLRQFADLHKEIDVTGGYLAVGQVRERVGASSG